MAITSRASSERALNPRSDPLTPWWHVDLALVLAALGLAAMGVALIYSATRGTDPSGYDTFFLERQAMFVIVGAGVGTGAALLPYKRLRALAPLVYVVGLIGVAVVLTPLGETVNGTKAWISVGSFQLQPSEFVKVAYIVVLAAYFARVGGTGEPLQLRQLATALLIAAPPLVFIMLQPDVGTALVFVAITMGMLLVGGIKLRHVVALTIIGAIATFAVVNSALLEDYQRERLTSFIAPGDVSTDAAFQQKQAQIAIGSGGLTGSGFGEGAQTRGNWVPEQQTDFIFTVVGEEFGFVGAAAMLLLFAIVIWRTWRTAQLASDAFGGLICAGVLTMIVFQMFESVGMTLGIMPITGIPLPFVSYGGSSALTSFVAVGLVVNVHMRRHEFERRSF